MLLESRDGDWLFNAGRERPPSGKHRGTLIWLLDSIYGVLGLFGCLLFLFN